MTLVSAAHDQETPGRVPGGGQLAELREELRDGETGGGDRGVVEQVGHGGQNYVRSAQKWLLNSMPLGAEMRNNHEHGRD